MAGPYDIAGTGIQAVAQPAALIVTATHLGTRVTQGTANPPNYRNIGQLTPGDADGWYGAVPIRVSPQKIVLPAGVTQLGYGLLAGSTVHVVEVPAAPVANSSLEPWDRNPVPWTSSQDPAQIGGGQVDVQVWTYTVPAGKVLRVTNVSCAVIQAVAPTTDGTAFSYVLIGAQIVGYAQLYSGLGERADRNELVDVFDLPAGQSLIGRWANNQGGGQVLMISKAVGYLFDA